jgi:hypothetical protein
MQDSTIQVNLLFLDDGVEGIELLTLWGFMRKDCTNRTHSILGNLLSTMTTKISLWSKIEGKQQTK